MNAPAAPDLVARFVAAILARQTEIAADFDQVNAGEIVIHWNRMMGTVKIETRVSRTYTPPRATGTPP